MAGRPTDRASLEAYARQAAQRVGIDPAIFVAQIDQESGFSPSAHNPSGASGIAQLMPQYYPNVDTSDPYASLDAAAATDAANLKQFGGRYDLMLAAYDAGAGAVQQAGGVPQIPETQTYVRNILGAAAPMGGSQRLMGQNQEGSTPPDDISSIIDAAVNGGGDTTDTSSGQGGFIGPAAPGETVAGVGPAATGGAPSGIDGTTILRMIEAKLGGGEAEAVISPRTLRKANPNPYDLNRTIDVPNQQITKRYTWPDGKSIDIVFETGKPAYVKGGTALAALSTGTAANVKEFPDHSLRQEDESQPVGSPNRWKVIAPPPDATNAAPKTIKTPQGSYEYYPSTGWTVIPGTEPPGAHVQFHTLPDGSFQQFDPDAIDPKTGQRGVWTMIQPRYVDPLEQATKEAALAKAQQALLPEQQKMVQDAYASIDLIKQRMGNGLIDPKEGTALMESIHQNLAAGLAGTTLFQQQQEQERRKEALGTLGSNLLRDRVSQGASLASSLLNAAVGHVLLPKGQTTLGIDPMSIAENAINRLQGGSQVTDAARAMFLGATGAAPGASGAPPTPSFPTTREAVLAQYPQLAQALQGAVPAAVPNIPMGGPQNGEWQLGQAPTPAGVGS